MRAQHERRTAAGAADTRHETGAAGYVAERRLRGGQPREALPRMRDSLDRQSQRFDPGGDPIDDRMLVFEDAPDANQIAEQLLPLRRAPGEERLSGHSTSVVARGW